MTTVPGIDVSYWDAGIDWPKVRATGQRFTFVKATEGESYTDPTFDDNWVGAKAAGMLRGAYHFFRCNADPAKQAARFLGAMDALDDKGELPPVIDLETNDGQTTAKVISRVKAWMDLVQAATGRKPIIYSGTYFLQDHFAEAGGGPPAWAKDYPLWIAQYPHTYVPGTAPLLPRGWFAWTFWQYSDKGQVNGINARVDMNVFNGSVEDLYQFCGLTPPVETPKKHVVAAGDTFDSIATKYGITVRDLAADNLQLLKPGDELTIPPAPGGGTPPSAPKTYTVRSGDTLTSIAVKCGTTVAALASLNNIRDINNIKVGLVLKIP